MGYAFSFLGQDLTGVLYDYTGGAVHFPDYVEFFTGSFRTSASEVSFQTNLVEPCPVSAQISGRTSSNSPDAANYTSYIWGNLYPLNKESGVYGLSFTGSFWDQKKDSAFFVSIYSGTVSGTTKDEGSFVIWQSGEVIGCAKDQSSVGIIQSGENLSAVPDLVPFALSLGSGEVSLAPKDKTNLTLIFSGTSLTTGHWTATRSSGDEATMSLSHFKISIGY